MATVAKTSQITVSKTLITIKAITPKMAKQIQICPYTGPNQPDKPHQLIWNSLEHGDNAPLGWVYADFIGGSGGPSFIRFWLVKLDNQLYWWVPPTGGPIHDKWAPTLEQLFIA